MAQITIARSMLMKNGMTPAAIDAMPAWDFLVFLSSLPTIQAMENPFAGASED